MVDGKDNHDRLYVAEARETNFILLTVSALISGCYPFL